MQQNKQLLN